MKRITILAGLAALLGAGSYALADRDEDDDHGDRERHGEKRGPRIDDSAARATPQWATYEAECGSCHLAVSPGQLPARSWSALLAGLTDHFGQNAELDAATRKTLGAWLATHAATATQGVPLRITTLPWWVRKHDEVDPSVFKRKAIASRANCGACHPAAKQGSFDEDTVKIPRPDAPAAR